MLLVAKFLSLLVLPLLSYTIAQGVYAIFIQKKYQISDKVARLDQMVSAGSARVCIGKVSMED